MRILINKYLIFLHIVLAFNPVYSLKSQSFKHIDRFSINKYYKAFNNGSGCINDSLINEGLCLNYRFDKGENSSFTLINNYDIAPQDFSYKPDKFTLTIRGGNKLDQIRVRFWEDNNFNRKFDDKDEVFASDYFPLGDSTLKTIQISVKSLKRIDGYGNDLLDLNRIRAWDIEVLSRNINSHSGTLCLNDFGFYSSHISVYSDKALLTGTFITLNNSDSTKNGNWTQQKWNSELLEMKKMGMNKIIIQFSAHQNIAWYSPSKLSFVSNNKPVINKIFVAAETVGIKVFTGLYFDELWYKSNKELETTYVDLLIKQKAIIDELYSQFGTSNMFAGWYIPQEVNDFDWQTDTKKKLLFDWLQNVAAYAHSKNAAKYVIISPYFNLWLPADVIELWVNDLLITARDIDWIYPQDGVGTSLKDVHIDLPNYCNHIKSACTKQNRKFGVTVESFQQLSGWPINTGVFSAVPISVNQLNDQVQEAYQLDPNDIILFNWDYLMKN